MAVLFLEENGSFMSLTVKRTVSHKSITVPTKRT
jgi:hypothetical protein